MLLGAGAWAGQTAARSLPPQVAIAYHAVPASHAADPLTPRAAECPGGICLGAAVIPDRADTDLRRRLATGALRYAVSQHTSPPGINPLPMPFPPRPDAPID